MLRVFTSIKRMQVWRSNRLPCLTVCTNTHKPMDPGRLVLLYSSWCILVKITSGSTLKAQKRCWITFVFQVELNNKGIFIPSESDVDISVPQGVEVAEPLEGVAITLLR